MTESICLCDVNKPFKTVQSVANFQWHGCYRIAWNHSTLTSQNLRHVGFTLMPQWRDI